MKILLPGLLAAAAALITAGCTEDTYRHGHGGGLYVSTPQYYEGYYDNYYGPFYDGYWAGNDFFFRSADGQAYQRDDGHHFRREPAPGFHPVQGVTHAPTTSGRP